MIQRALTFALVVFAAAPAYAQEHAEPALSPFAGNVGNAIWTLGIFLVVVVLLGKFAWGPILSLLQQREEFIRKSLADAKRDREEAEARLKDYTQQIRNARAEAQTIIEEARRDAARLRDELRGKAQAEAEGLITNAERHIQLETARAVQQIRAEAVDISVQIASKLIQRNLSADDNAKLIADTLQQIDGRKH
jgi:F-type H+-transporting ATPase subunit b